MPGGRPVSTYTPEHIEEIRLAMEEYIEETDIPIAAEFAVLQGMYRQRLYDIPQLADTLKRLITKKEAQLERLGLRNDVNTTMAIFSLKQLGWSDKVESVVQSVELTKEERDARLAELLSKRSEKSEEPK